MKVALCFSGFIREVDQTKEFWLDLISKYNIDVYASFWEDKEEKVEKFKQIYNPKKLELENYSAFKNSTQTIASSYITTPEHPYTLTSDLDELAKEFRAFPIFYKIWKSNMLIGDEKYDIVIRARTDITFDNLELIQNDMLNVPMGTVEVSFWPNSLGINDCFAYGSQDIMNYYSFLYNNLMKYLDKGHYMFPPEHLLAVHLSYNKLPIRYFPLYMTLVNTKPGKESLVYNRFITTPYEDVIWSNTMNFEPHPGINFKKQQYEQNN
jgi:hypothetical protein